MNIKEAIRTIFVILLWRSYLLVKSQANHHIYSDQDLEATDSQHSHSIVVTVSPPPDFLKSSFKSFISHKIPRQLQTEMLKQKTSRNSRVGPANNLVFLPTPLPAKRIRTIKSKLVPFKDPPLKITSKIESSFGKRSRNGSYSFCYSTTNGMSRSEIGKVSSGGGLSVSGQYQYVGTDGLLYNISFIADKHGYRPRITKVSKIRSKLQSTNFIIKSRERVPRNVLLGRIKKVQRGNNILKKVSKLRRSIVNP